MTCAVGPATIQRGSSFLAVMPTVGIGMFLSDCPIEVASPSRIKGAWETIAVGVIASSREIAVFCESI